MIELTNNTTGNNPNVRKVDFLVVPTIEDRDSIILGRRKEGMLVKVISNGITYELTNDLSNDSWVISLLSVEYVQTYDEISSSTNKRFIVVQVDDENNEGYTGLYFHNGNVISEILLL